MGRCGLKPLGSLDRAGASPAPGTASELGKQVSEILAVRGRTRLFGKIVNEIVNESAARCRQTSLSSDVGGRGWTGQHGGDGGFGALRSGVCSDPGSAFGLIGPRSGCLPDRLRFHRLLRDSARLSCTRAAAVTIRCEGWWGCSRGGAFLTMVTGCSFRTYVRPVERVSSLTAERLTCSTRPTDSGAKKTKHVRACPEQWPQQRQLLGIGR
jgi:hypothetical protein